MIEFEEILIRIAKVQDFEGKYYWIPEKLLPQFSKAVAKLRGWEYGDYPQRFDDFILEYSIYRTLGGPDKAPKIFGM